ncbi:MAG: hypothetical protein AAGJ35_05615 [Myxococcota bacterium]
MRAVKGSCAAKESVFAPVDSRCATEYVSIHKWTEFIVAGVGMLVHRALYVRKRSVYAPVERLRRRLASERVWIFKHLTIIVENVDTSVDFKNVVYRANVAVERGGVDVMVAA